MIRILLFLPLIFAVTPNTGSASAQVRSVEISGQVRYALGGTPAIDVVVRLDQVSGGYVAEARTDRLGKFRFTGLAPIQYHIVIRHFGYREIVQEVNLIMASSDYVQFQLVKEKAASSAPPVSGTKVVDANVPLEARREFEKSEPLLATGKKEQIEEGTRHLERAVQIYPGFLEAQLKLGTVYMDMREWKKAEQTLQRALDTSPNTPNVLFALGELYFQLKRTNDAEKILRQGLSIEPRSWQGHFTLGRLYFDQNDIVKAGKQIAITLQLNPTLAEAHLVAGNIWLRAGKPQEAKFEFEEYLRLAPKGKYVAQVKEVVLKIQQGHK